VRDFLSGAYSMTSDEIEREARELVEQYGTAAARIARVRAEIAEKHIRNQGLARTWHDIADTIEILLTTPP
jgi:hypothetical protein